MFQQLAHFFAAERIVSQVGQADPFCAERFVIGLRLWRRIACSFGEENNPQSCTSRRRRMFDAQDACQAHVHASFFQRFTNRAGRERFIGFDSSCRHVPGLAELALVNEQKAIVVLDNNQVGIGSRGTCILPS